jgi:hydrogenase nickel incorporation protein HypA/HybF
MHEVGIMHNILDRAIERAKQEGAQHIDRVHMRVGDESGVEDGSLSLAFEVAKKGTIAENAQLEVEHLPVLCYCNNCNLEFTPRDLLYECPDCKQPYCEVRQGKELDLAYLDVS